MAVRSFIPFTAALSFTLRVALKTNGEMRPSLPIIHSPDVDATAMQNVVSAMGLSRSPLVKRRLSPTAARHRLDGSHHGNRGTYKFHYLAPRGCKCADNDVVDAASGE
jgi:hypothetical protein